MKCDELKRKYSDITGPYYGYNEVNEAIAELKDEIKRNEGVGQRWFEQCMEARTENVRMKRALWLARTSTARYAKMFWEKNVILNESLYFTIDCRCYEKGMKEQTLRPSEWAKIWSEVESKCRAKAEEYK